MSLNSTLESVESFAGSPTSSHGNSQQLFVTTTRVRNQHLGLAQMRGVIQIHNHYFPKGTGKRMNKDEKNRKWISYKNRIYQEYGRIITGKYASEKALVKRYSQPLSFLKYKLKRATNLNVSELSQADKDYFHEIGGIDDINELIKKTYNIDSVEKASENFQTLFGGRKRRRLNQANDNPNDNSHNTNSNNPQQGNDAEHIDLLQFPPVTEPKTENGNSKPTLLPALSFLQSKLDIFEQEQLEKKKLETREITKQKIIALSETIEAQFNGKAHLIGCIPGIAGGDQEKLAFNCWINKYKQSINRSVCAADHSITIRCICMECIFREVEIEQNYVQ